MSVEAKRVGVKAQNMPLIPLGVCREALLRLVELSSRVYEIEFELDQIRRVLLEQSEKIPS